MLSRIGLWTLTGKSGEARIIGEMTEHAFLSMMLAIVPFQGSDHVGATMMLNRDFTTSDRAGTRRVPLMRPYAWRRGGQGSQDGDIVRRA